MAVRGIIPWRRREEEPEGLLRRSDFPGSFMDLQKEINSLFESFFRGAELDFPWRGAETRFTPRVDVSETDDAVLVKAELPGMEEKDVDVTLDNHQLIMKGEKKEEKEDKVRGVQRVERSYGSFYRSIPIPADVDEDKIEANFKRGVLDIKLPKTQADKEKRRKIEVKKAS